MNISDVELQKQATELLVLWEKEFEAATGNKPFVDSDKDTDSFRRLIRKAGFEYARVIIIGYFKSKNEWVREKGFPISYLMANLNEVVANLNEAVGQKKGRMHWVLEFTEDGTPIVSHNPSELADKTNFKPVPWNEWLAMSYKDRCGCLPQNELWFRNWKEMDKEWNFYIYGTGPTKIGEKLIP